MEQHYKGLFNIFKPEENLSLSLFNSEEFFWLTTVISISFASEELAKYQGKFSEAFKSQVEPKNSQPFIEIFKESIKSGYISPEKQKEVQKAALSNLKILADYAHSLSVFTPKEGIILGKTFATYWLIFKLIEAEWQQILNSEELQETYMSLDIVIMDHEELEQLEERCMKGEDLSNDDELYLRSHWTRVKNFWTKLYQDLYLLAGGWIKFQPPYKK